MFDHSLRSPALLPWLALAALGLLWVGLSGCVSTYSAGESTNEAPGDGEDTATDDADTDDGADDGSDDQDGEDDDGNGGEGDGNGDDNQPPEADCDDTLDDDDDGLVDCEDPDCDAEFQCTWPQEVALHTVVEFFANSIAQTFGVGDCVTEYSGTLGLADSDLGCPDCDLEYEGPVTFGPDGCPDDYIDRPATMAFGFVFQTETEREVWKKDSETQVWENLGAVSDSGLGVFSVTRDEPVMYEVPLLGTTEVGSFTLSQTLTDL